jgi:hypothetical protein
MSPQSSPGRPRPDASPPPSFPSVRPLRHGPVAVVRTAALVALACGPLALTTLVWTAPYKAAHLPAERAAHRADPAAHTAQDPGGFAEVFVGLWLRGAQSGAQETASQEALRAMAPGAALPEFGSRPPEVRQVGAVRSVPVRPGLWSVTVAALLDEDGNGAKGGAVRYFRVPVILGEASGGTQSFTVTATPAVVAGPAAKSAPSSVYGTELRTGSALSVTVSGFMSAYLGGAGGAERYLAPRVQLPALKSAFATVRTERVSAVGPTDGAIAEDGQRVRVSAQVTASDAQGREWPLTYALRLGTRDGRWEVLGLESGLEGAVSDESKGGM